VRYASEWASISYCSEVCLRVGKHLLDVLKASAFSDDVFHQGRLQEFLLTWGVQCPNQLPRFTTHWQAWFSLFYVIRRNGPVIVMRCSTTSFIRRFLIRDDW
jgi:hypothetical protein